MSVLNRVRSALVCPPTEQARRLARLRATRLALPHDWFLSVLNQHRRIDAAFDALALHRSPPFCRAAQRRLAALLSSHALAKSTVLYPALASIGRPCWARHAFLGHVGIQAQLDRFTDLDRNRAQFAQAVEDLRTGFDLLAYDEESQWLPLLAARLPPAEQQRLSGRFRPEFERSMKEHGLFAGFDAKAGGSTLPAGPDQTLEGCPAG